MGATNAIAETTISVANILAKARTFKLLNCFSEWKCDRRYFNSSMKLSEDDLVFGNTANSGFPAIIGSVPPEAKLFGYEVIPTNLECDSREGFGIIDYSRYVTIFNNNNQTPEVYTDMIGFLYSSVARNMEINSLSAMKMGSKYYVKVNKYEGKVTITGPSLKLTAEIKADVHYVPVFSCGCSNNQLKIRPLLSLSLIHI
eukprot:TRINITY_DN9477_c0_g5_i3.p2 TRINITY_DN9477_c0_g5~~TRINITY_DN9477_c0_g5_i3.p2  ORF type:complete len:200 (-),score=14.01 TRINITY_DN9477_c0_g5_i3:172-771(-)